MHECDETTQDKEKNHWKQQQRQYPELTQEQLFCFSLSPYLKTCLLFQREKKKEKETDRGRSNGPLLYSPQPGIEPATHVVRDNTELPRQSQARNNSCSHQPVWGTRQSTWKCSLMSQNQLQNKGCSSITQQSLKASLQLFPNYNPRTNHKNIFRNTKMSSNHRSKTYV